MPKVAIGGNYERKVLFMREARGEEGRDAEMEAKTRRSSRLK